MQRFPNPPSQPRQSPVPPPDGNREHHYTPAGKRERKESRGHSLWPSTGLQDPLRHTTSLLTAIRRPGEAGATAYGLATGLQDPSSHDEPPDGNWESAGSRGQSLRPSIGNKIHFVTDEHPDGNRENEGSRGHSLRPSNVGVPPIAALPGGNRESRESRGHCLRPSNVGPFSFGRGVEEERRCRRVALTRYFGGSPCTKPTPRENWERRNAGATAYGLAMWEYYNNMHCM
jgi:hypothetical protein